MLGIMHDPCKYCSLMLTKERDAIIKPDPVYQSLMFNDDSDACILRVPQQYSVIDLNNDRDTSIGN